MSESLQEYPLNEWLPRTSALPGIASIQDVDYNPWSAGSGAGGAPVTTVQLDVCEMVDDVLTTNTYRFLIQA